MQRLAIVLLFCCSASAAPDELSALRAKLPASWTMARGKDFFALRTKVTVVGQHLPNESPFAKPGKPPAGKPTTLELRYRLEPKWSATKHARAEAFNDKLGAEYKKAAEKYRIAEIKTGKGMPLPANADEQDRLAKYEAEVKKLDARRRALPLCNLGRFSIFADAGTYRQLSLEVQPESAMTEAYKLVETVKELCGAK